MHYFIDGYNLLFRILKAGEDLKHQREDLTRDLETKIDILGIDATLVFDSHYQEDESTRSHFKSLEIVFSGKDETADDYILHAVKESSTPQEHTVVTSDKKLAHQCLLRLAKTETVEAFLASLNRRYKNKLRQRKMLLKPPPSTPEPPPPAPSAPAKKDSPESCFDFYLNTFEQELTQSQAESPKKTKQPPQQKPRKVKEEKPQQKEDHLSDTDRWLRAFERDEREK